MDKTDADKWELLEALYKNGADTEILIKSLPKWTKAEIQHAVKRFRNRAKRKLLDEEKSTKTASLNHWVKLTDNLHQLQGSTNNPWWRKGRARLSDEPKDQAPILSKALMYAACFEDHYQGSAPDDPNYSEIYRYLSQLVEGTEPTQLSPGSAAKVLEILNKIKKVVTHDSGLESTTYLEEMEVSYFPTGEEKSNKRQKKAVGPEPGDKPEAESPLLSCPLFEDDDDDGKSLSLEPGDPYYEMKKEAFIKKVQSKQQEAASSISSLPGMNPLEIPTRLLVKPAISIVEPPQNL